VTALLVALGGALGAVARWAVGQRLPGRRGTLAVNVAGSFALGVLLAQGASSSAYALLGLGFCGAFTTFSAFALDSSEGEGRTVARMWTAVVTLALCVTAAAVGLRL
jgi:fluoride exporter